MILIIGAGIAGLTTAIALKQKGIEFRIFEAVPEIKPLGAGLTLAGNAMLIMKQLGLDEQIKKKGHQLSSLIIQDDRGKFISVLDAESLSNRYGMDNVAIHRGDLHEILLDQLDAEQVLTGRKAVEVRQRSQGVTIHFEDGATVDGTAAIIADGIHSAIRSKLVPGSRPRYAGYTCWRGITEDRWGIDKLAVESWGTQGRFGYVPIGGNMIYWFACKNAPPHDAEMKRWQIKDIQENFGNFATPIPSIIAHTPDDALIWSDIVDIKPLKQYAFDKVLLIGDAAHATTPNLGQGACMGVEDAMAVALALEQEPEARKAFLNFEQKRLDRVRFIVNTSWRLGKLAQWESTFLAGLRNALMRLLPESVNRRQVARVLNIAEV